MNHLPIDQVQLDHRLIFEDFSDNGPNISPETDRLQYSFSSKSSQIWNLPPKLQINEVNCLRHKPLPSASLSSRLSSATTDKTPFWSSTKGQHHLSSSTSGLFIFPLPLGPFKSSRSLYLRIIQITSIFLSFILLYVLVSSIRDSVFKEDKFFVGDKLNFNSWIISPLANNNLDNPVESNKLLDLKNFDFILNNVSKCSLNKEDDKIFFIILVHSAPNNFKERQAIRSTWGSVQVFDNFFIRLVFLLGTGNDLSTTREHDQFGDIVSGNFVDSYRNLTYKHLMGYKWALRYCSNAKFVLKTDDDAFVDIYQLINFLRRTFGDNPKKGLICNVLPEGTRPVRVGDNYNSESKSEDGSKSKWSVTKEEYPYEIYPKYCSGLAYLATPDVLHDLLSISSSVKYMWIDDVFVTGIIRDLATVEPFYLNLRYSYETQGYRKWLTKGGHDFGDEKVKRLTSSSNSINNERDYKQRLPFIFAHLERGKLLGDEMMDLWQKVLSI